MEPNFHPNPLTESISISPYIPHFSPYSFITNPTDFFSQVCGRVYCKQCVSKGMGEMPEGRKCIACVGHRFSRRSSSY